MTHTSIVQNGSLSISIQVHRAFIDINIPSYFLPPVISLIPSPTISSSGILHIPISICSLGSSNSLWNNRPNIKYCLQQIRHYLFSTFLSCCFNLLYFDFGFFVGFFFGFLVAACVLCPIHIRLLFLSLGLFMG